MRWLRSALLRTASVTFSPSGSNRIAQPLDVLGVSSDLTNFGYYKSKILRPGCGVTANDVGPDGSTEFDAFEGVINFYLPQHRWVRKETPEDPNGIAMEEVPEDERVTPETVQALVDAYNADKGGAVVLRLDKVETSASRGTPVARISIVKNDTQGYTQVPEANMANANAHKVLELLAQYGLPVDPDEYSGSFSIDDYWTARGLMDEEAMRAKTVEPSQSKGWGGFYEGLGMPDPRGEPQNAWEAEERKKEEARGPNVYNQGMTYERLLGYFEGLDQLAQWIKDQKLPDRTISFG